MDNVMDIEKEVRSAIPDVLAKMRENIVFKMGQEAEVVAMDILRATVKKWVTDELAPEVVAQLSKNKSALIAEAETIAENLAAAISEAIGAQAKKSLANSYLVKEISDKLFRGY